MTIIRNKRAVGFFSSHEEAEDALNQLREGKFPMDQVSLIAKDTDRFKSNPSEYGVKTSAVAGGAIAGGTVGGIAGLLVGLGTLAIPGIGMIVLIGTTATAIATTLAGSAIGVIAGSLVGGLVGLGIPEDKAQIYHDHIVNGSYLVIVDGSEAEIIQVEDILRHKGIHEWGVYNIPASRNYLEPVVSL
ncbi:general stress protein [Pseudanabaena sp. 'Roaring Creek']|uniref:general stress protein n=1 Tax=Pseudanabaena sp. 'Roaring Creek' TaxID=1681830 RepID=UPI0006D77948|nr:hypothetical protein [Pseudanabaena sp. 'Roaring Creek']